MSTPLKQFWLWEAPKRVCDVVFACLIILLGAPLMAIIAVLIKLDSSGPIFFRQRRLGRYRKEFEILKFRTMIVDSPNNNANLECFENDRRVTKIGKYLRRYSLDELPQVVNILVGKMSFIGPRPPVVNELDFEKFTDEQLERFSIKPGITGYAQINGRNSRTWREKIEFDLKYIQKVRKYGIFFDLKIFFQTIPYVLMQRDVFQEYSQVCELEIAFKNR